jgi:hypothetical protein
LAARRDDQTPLISLTDQLAAVLPPEGLKVHRIQNFVQVSAGRIGYAPKPATARSESPILHARRKSKAMIDDKKSTDPGLSAAERKELRSREAKEAIADHEEAQRALHENHERLRAERMAREAAAGPMLYPAPQLPDDTSLDSVRFSTRIRNAVTAAGWKTVGEIREASDATLLGLQDLGKGSVAHLRETLGRPSKDEVRRAGLKAKGK